MRCWLQSQPLPIPQPQPVMALMLRTAKSTPLELRESCSCTTCELQNIAAISEFGRAYSINDANTKTQGLRPGFLCSSSGRTRTHFHHYLNNVPICLILTANHYENIAHLHVRQVRSGDYAHQRSGCRCWIAGGAGTDSEMISRSKCDPAMTGSPQRAADRTG